MLSKIKSLTVLPLLLMTLSGCWSGGTEIKTAQLIPLANVPSDIRVCFKNLTGAPMPGAMSRQDIVALITRLRISEQRKSRCGQRLLGLYDSQKALFSN